jgi:hypothetical protein
MRASILNPPVEINNILYNYVVEFDTDFGAGAKEIGTFQIEKNLNNGWVTFSRGTQTGFYVLSDNRPGTAQTIVYNCTTGGNVVDSPENMRLYSPFNDMARRGSLASERIIPGDVLRVNRGNKTIYWEVIQTEAYGHPPDFVDYTSNDQSVSSYVSVLMSNVRFVPLSDNQQINFDLHLCGVGIDGNTLTRKIFNNDPLQLPRDLVLQNGEYYYNPITHEVRFANSQSGTNVFYGYWSVAEQEQKDQQSNSIFAAITDNAFAGISVTGEDFDEIVINYVDINNPWQFQFELLNKLFIKFDVDSGISDYGWRESVNDNWSQTLFNFNNYSPSNPNGLQIRAWRVGNRLRVSIGGIVVFDQTNKLLGGHQIGMRAVGHEQIFSYGNTPKTVTVRSTGQVGRYVFVQKEFGERLELQPLLGHTLVKIENLTTGELMSGGAGRNKYNDIADLYIRLNRETEFDLILLQFQPIVPRTAPGLAFRTYEGQDNFSEINEEGRGPNDPPIATTNVSKNRANWFDKALVFNPQGLQLQEGDEVVCVRSYGHSPAGFNPTFEVKDGNDFVPISPPFFFDNINGLLYLQSENLPQDEVIIKPTFPRVYRSGHHAEYYNELKRAAESLSNLWTVSQDPGGVGFAFFVDAAQEFGPEGFELRQLPASDCSIFYPTNYVMGLSKGEVHQYNYFDVVLQQYRVKEMGYFVDHNLWQDLFLRTTPLPNVQTVHHQTGCDSVQWNSHETYLVGEGKINANFFGLAPLVTGPLFFGSPLPVEWGLGTTVFKKRYSTANIGSVGFRAGALIYKLPKNSSIIEAKALIKFSGLRSYEWEWDAVQLHDYGFAQYKINGIVTHYNSYGLLAPEPPEGYAGPIDDYMIQPWFWNDSGMLTFDAIGVRYDSRRVYRLNNPDEGELILPHKRLLSGMGGISATPLSLVQNNQWCEVDVTRAMRTLLTLNDSETQEVVLCPSVGINASDVVNPLTLGNYGQSLMNTNSISWVDQFPHSPGFIGTSRGRYFEYDGISMGPIYVRFTVGGDSKVYQLLIPPEEYLS